MKKLLLLLSFAVAAFGQSSNIAFVTNDPDGACGDFAQPKLNRTTGQLFSCVDGMWRGSWTVSKGTSDLPLSANDELPSFSANIFTSDPGPDGFLTNAGFYMGYTGSATLGIANGMMVGGDNIGTGTITNLTNMLLNAFQSDQGGTIVNQYALRIADINTATNNYAIKTGLGKVEFGDSITVQLTDGNGSGIYTNLTATQSAVNPALWYGFSTVTGGTQTYALGLEPILRFTGGTTTGAWGVYVDAAEVSGGAVLTNMYGLEIGDQTAATNNYAIKTGKGKVEFGDDLSVIGKLYLTPQTPASSSATCTANQVAMDANYVYVCTAADTWKRAALSTW